MVDRGRSRRKRGGGRGAFSLLDLTVAMALMAVGFGAVVYSMIEAMALQRFAHERSAALDAAENVLEAMQAEVFREVFARFNATTADDPPGVSPGDGFAVPGLNPLPGDADGLAGQIEFPGGGVQLLENIADPDLGMPRDLNGDGLPPDGLDHALDYLVLPVRVRVSWNGARGDSELIVTTTLNNESKP